MLYILALYDSDESIPEKKIPLFFKGIFEKRFGIKYFPSDLNIRDMLGFPDAEQGAVAHVQELFQISIVVVSEITVPVFSQRV